MTPKIKMLSAMILLVAAGFLTQGCCKGSKDKGEGPKEESAATTEEEAVKKEAEELVKAMKALGGAAGKGGSLPPTDNKEAKLSIDEPSINVNRSKYSTIVYCYVKNDGTMTNSATIKATFKDASGTVLGTATGSVNDIPAGGKKPVQLFSSDKIDKDAEIAVDVDYVHGYGKEGAADIEASNITAKKKFGYPKVTGEVENKGSDPHSFTPQAVFFDKDGNILSMAFCGPVNDLGSGQKKAFECNGSDKIKSWDDLQVIVGTMLK
jgi:hypothetical protein